MATEIKGVGIDIIEVKKFSFCAKKDGNSNRFVRDNFTKKEIEYCFSFKSPSPHLAGTFAAKEAIFKSMGQKNIALSSIEIRRNKDGKPEVWIAGLRQKSILLSISHTDEYAAAIAIKNK